MFLLTILCNLYRLLCVKIPRDQQFQKYLNQPIWYQQACHGQSHQDQMFLNSNVKHKQELKPLTCVCIYLYGVYQ